HPGDTKVLTMKMEILLEPTSNKLLVDQFLINQWSFNSLVHALRDLSTLRRSGLRTAGATAKPYQGDSLKFYLITGQFFDSDLEVTFRKHSCYVRDVDGVDLLKGSRGSNLYTISVEDMMKSSPICLLSKASKKKSWLWHHRLNHLNFDTINDLVRKDLHNAVVERHNHTLVEAAQTMLIFYKALMFLWEEAVATACYTQKRSLIHTCYDKTPYELMHDIGIFIGYVPNRKGYIIYNKRTRRIMETIHVQFDEMTEHMAPVHIGSGPEPILLTPGQISLGVETPVPAAPATQVPVNSAGTPFFTTIDQDAPSTSYSPSSSEVQAPISHQGVVAVPTIKDNLFAQAEDDPFVNVFVPKPSSEESSSGDILFKDYKHYGNGKNAYELKGKFLDDLHNNAFSEWHTCSWRKDGYCNGGNLPGAYIVGNTLRYQDLEWYDALKDSELKEEALRDKAIMKGLINEDVESNNEGWRCWDDFESTNGDRNEWEYENEHGDDERYELCGNETHELPVFNIRRFEMIKYSFGQDEEYVAVKENEYEDLTSTFRAYQEIFHMMDE
nr:retrovirus-related Pol polyprotein from transposon TNT 1-94 [Tanacetum cinerariifolium]